MSTLFGACSSKVITFHGVLPSDQHNNNDNMTKILLYVLFLLNK